MATPNWIAASPGSAPLAAQVNQFLGTHPSTIVYTGTSQVSHTTAGSGGVNTNGLYLAQSFTAPSTLAVSRIVLTLSVTGAPLAASVSIQTNNAGAPSGTLAGSPAQVSLPPGFVGASSGSISMPLPASLTSGATYWIVVGAVGDVSNFFTWFKSNQVSGASTSANGSTWSAQAYGLMFNVFSASYSGYPVHTFSDAGARWATFTVAATTSALTSLGEYTVAQAAGDYVSSVRTFGYTNGLLTSTT